MEVDYNKLGELIDGYGGIAADDLAALPAVSDARDEEIALLRAENEILRSEIIRSDVETSRLRQTLAEIELLLVSIRGGIADGGDIMGRAACNATCPNCATCSTLRSTSGTGGRR